MFVGSAFLRDRTRGAGWVDVNGDGVIDFYDPGTVDPYGAPALHHHRRLQPRPTRVSSSRTASPSALSTSPAALLGSSHISGSVQQFSVGYMLGTLTVDGDLGTFSSGTDAGL